MRGGTVLVLLAAAAVPARGTGGATVAPCDAGSAAQAWRLRAGWGQPATLVNLAGSGEPQCLDVADRSKRAGAAVRSWNCCCDPESGLADANGTSVCGSPGRKPPCGDTKDNYNQIYELNSQGQLTTGKVMGEKCLVLTPAGAIQTADCTASATKWEYTASESPPLRLAANRSMCLSTSGSGSGGGRPSPDPEGPVEPVPQACTTPNTSKLPFCNAQLSTDKRVADLLQRLTTEEKLTQLIGGIGGGVTVGVRDLFPPYQYHSEGLHGLRSTCGLNKNGPAQQPGTLYSTLFPQVTAMAATGNLTLIKAMGAHMGDEARAVNNYMQGNTVAKGGGLDYWGPTMNIGRDPRWGRTQESVSEDPFLNGACTIAISSRLTACARWFSQQRHCLQTPRTLCAASREPTTAWASSRPPPAANISTCALRSLLFVIIIWLLTVARLRHRRTAWKVRMGSPGTTLMRR